jgi:hypothetical protein
VTRGLNELLRRHTPLRLTSTEKDSDAANELLAECLKLLNLGVTADTMIRWFVADRPGKSGKTSE